MVNRDYRCIAMRPRTTSREESVRVLLLFMPILLFNAWILALYQRANPGKAQIRAGILHAACPGKDIPVFVNAVAFARCLRDGGKHLM